MSSQTEKRLSLRVESIIFFLVCLTLVRCDFYTSVAGLEQLLDSEIYLLEAFENYIKDVEITNKQIESFLDDVETIHKEIDLDPEHYFMDPINALKTIKRLAFDWKLIDQFVLLDPDGQNFATNFTNMQSLGFVNATAEDLIGASTGLARLQKTYGLESIDIADGILMDFNYGTMLSAHDAFVLGQTLFVTKNYNASVDWLLQARIVFYNERHQNINSFPRIRDVNILEYLAPSLFHAGNYKMAVLLNEELLAQEPNNPYGLENKQLFDTHMHAERSVLLEFSKTPVKQDSELFKLTEAVCRGSLRQTPAEKRNLRCRYVNNNVPFCKIAPFKMEELNIDPAVSVYHNVIYQNEMEMVINATEDYVERSMVGDVNKPVKSDYRTSKTAWLFYEESSFLNSLKKRLQDVTGLNFLQAEPLQVVNYGIGGHYGPHHDSVEDPETGFPGRGNRILTALFYINFVELGGGTAFPYLRLLVPPQPGSLVVWSNLHESLEVDHRMIHAGCPVLKGSKWICNEWFHAVGQEFNRPCSLNKTGEISLPYKLRFKIN